MKKVSTIQIKGIAVICFLILIVCNFAKAQVNAYAKVTSISGHTISLSDVNESYGTFEDGMSIIIMQMQDADITGYTSNDNAFGKVNSIGSAGFYEIVKISSHTEVSALPSTITLSTGFVNTYNTAASLQIISYPTLGTLGFTTTVNINAVAWNGKVGGVVAFNVNGKLTLNHNISADGAGFRGGLVAGDDGSACITSTFISVASAKYGNKGEGVLAGVYGNTSNGFVAGRAPITNGGGGGSVSNAGGGGGANYTGGGDGGNGYSCSSTAGGMGGWDLSAFSGSARAFMGGGGGGGQQNNTKGTSGTNGGGIVIISADSILVKGTCSRSITANGTNSTNSGNDGAGGAGAAGTIVLNVNGLSVQSSCPLSVSASGGNGGTVNDPASHGAGGGGGHGVIYLSAATLPSNVAFATNNGTGGKNSNVVGATSAGSGKGTNGTGIFSGTTVVALPLHLLSFEGSPDHNGIQITWNTTNESNLASYELQKSSNAVDWEKVVVKEASNSLSQVEYSVEDSKPFAGKNYYRLYITEKDGIHSFSEIIQVNSINSGTKINIYPNPSTGSFYLETQEAIIASGISLVNMIGEKVEGVVETINSTKLKITMQDKSTGIYYLTLQTDNGIQIQKIIVSE